MLKTLSILGFLGMVGGLLGLLAMRSLFSPSPIIIALQAAAVLLLIWARITFGRRSFHAVANPTAGGLVTNGPYRHIRHPIYASVCLFVWAGVAGHLSLGAGLCGVLVLAGTVMRIFCEEKLVTARYPEYTAYATKTWRIVPYVF
jgi:protein-S-isoprenylcysteine O-methyltransferase Ste14